MSKRNTITELKLCTNYNRTFHGLKIPKGAYCGEDAQGYFAIWNYRVVGKTGYYRGMPRFKMWRRINAKWISVVEASPTTYGIMSKLEEWDDVPEVSWGEGKFSPATKQVKIKVSPYADFEYYGRKLPKGALYGSDEKGVFICLDFRIKGMKQGLPQLKMSRPVTYENELKNRVQWQNCIESSGTTYKCCEIVENLQLEIAYDLDAEAAEIASKRDLRPNKDATPYTCRFLYGTDSPKGESWLAVEHNIGLDRIAAAYKGKFVPLGVWDCVKLR